MRYREAAVRRDRGVKEEKRVRTSTRFAATASPLIDEHRVLPSVRLEPVRCQSVERDDLHGADNEQHSAFLTAAARVPHHE
jgi:hypothetical protein